MQQYLNAYVKGMESAFILPENKPSERMALFFVYLTTLILLRKQRCAESGAECLPNTQFVRCEDWSGESGIALYDRLLRIPYLSSSIVLWRSYLYYEYYCGNYNNAKHVFYSAINKCPYSKVLWTDAIRVLRPLMKNEEIINVLSYSQSKDILINNDFTQE